MINYIVNVIKTVDRKVVCECIEITPFVRNIKLSKIPERNPTDMPDDIFGRRAPITPPVNEPVRIRNDAITKNNFIFESK
jgi:hypothetical protein